MLLRKGILTPEIFICPSVSYAKADDYEKLVDNPNQRGNFTNLSGADTGGNGHNYTTGRI